MSQKKKFVKKGQVYRSLVAAALIANGVFQFIAPVLAEGTSGGETIDNTATATYEDPNNPGETINTTSNTVQVTVAEIAGITVTPAGTEFADGTDGDGNPVGDADGNEKISVGDKLYYNYTVTNVGNDPTKFRIPDQPTVTGQASIEGPVEISYDGGDNWVPVDAGGTTTNSINPDESVLVRVPVKIEAGAQPGETIGVQLGDTPGDDQNVPRDSDGGDVFTIDNADNEVDGEVSGVPANGTREASATLEAIVDEELKTYTLAKVLKVRSDHTVAGDDGPKDDTVTYDLSLEVENTDPTGNGISPAPLEGIEVPGVSTDANDKRILVSDAIPQDTQFESVVAPPGWTAVYVDSATPITNEKANTTTWTTSQPTNLANVRRVGFVRTGTIAPGQKLEGFKITVKVNTPADTTSVQIRNVAQLFGTSPSGAPVYDESGDNNPSNYNENGTPPAGTDIDGDPDGIPDTLPDDAVDDGLITTAELEPFGTDTQNNNTGTGEGGEANVFTINELGAVSLLNGPKDKPDAVAEDDNNKDFTNKSSLVPADSKPDVPIDPDGVNFSNTVLNTGKDPDPDNDADGNGEADIALLPVAPGSPLSPGSTDNVAGNTTDLPNETLVTLTYLEQKVTYKYNSADGTFSIESGTEITIPKVPAGETRNYGVEVNLPDGTNLSTDEAVERGYPVPIKAFVVDDTGTPLAEDGTAMAEGKTPAQNITIDRVYVGYLQMVKETRVIKADGPDVLDGEDTFSKEKKSPAPGNILEYRITYENISEPQSGTDNVILSASDIVITEDGTNDTLGNNWAKDNDENGEIDTSNITGSAIDSGGANIEFTPGADQTGTTPDTDVTKYVVVVSDDVEPKEMRTFIFQRRINGTGITGDPNTAPAPAPAPAP